LADGHVRHGRHKRVDPLPAVGELRTLATANPIGLGRAAAAPAFQQLDREARADVEPGGGGVPRHPPSAVRTTRSHIDTVRLGCGRSAATVE
jgi:hypothetical protein